MRVRIISIIFSAILSISVCSAGISAQLSGMVQKDGYLREGKGNKVIDNLTGRPVPNAVVSVPSKGVTTITDGSGSFNLDVSIDKPLIMSVKANGYQPFSVTITQNNANSPFVIGIEKNKLNEIVIDSTLHHLGDNNFSSSSANAGEFQTGAIGPRFTKSFYVKALRPDQTTYIKIGSIIGLDTEMAKRLRQNNIRFSVSSPATVYINSQPVGEIKINGDEQIINFPSSVLRQNAYNEVAVETGQNVQQHNYTDYDDIEFMNLILEIR